MKHIERLFADGHPVPGLKSTGRFAAPQTVYSDGDVEVLEDTPLHRLDRNDSESAGHEGRKDYPVALLKPFRASFPLVGAVAPGNSYSDRIRLLRTELLLRHPGGQSDTVAVAVIGAEAGEGRSVLAAELALSFAQLGRSTLLVDADLRNPRQHVLFGAAPGDGLVQAITRSDITSYYGVEDFPTLSVMTAGTATDANPSELLSDGRFDRLVGELARRFDFIVFDTPRFADYPDAQVIATVVGHVLTVHRAGHSSYRATRKMLRQLGPSQALLLGAVVNHF